MTRSPDRPVVAGVGHRGRFALGWTRHAVLHRATAPVAVVPLRWATR
ncbi:hypothetical protein [Blastococcus litoris]|nr:hypothetical protein [Blastococcus litoris]